MTLPEIPPPSWRTQLAFLVRKLVRPVTIERRAEVHIQLRDASHPNFDFFLLVVLSSVIATSGLLTDSAAVIIGAMLVAPLMSPIIGLGLASLTGDTKLLRDAASGLGRGAGLAVLIATLLALFNRFLPFVTLQDLPAEVLSRTRPSPIDLTIALAGGLAAAYALAQPSISAALPGVAIATALMPPLCTVGVGIALGRWDVAGGALLLFITNAVTIAFASMFIFFVLGFAPQRENSNRLPRTLVASALITAALLIPLTVLSIYFVSQASENRRINAVVTEEVDHYDAEVIDLKVNRDGDMLLMTLNLRTHRSLIYEDVVNLQKVIAFRLQRPVAIVVNQVFAARLDPLIPPTFTPTPTLAEFPITPSDTPIPTITYTPGPTNTPTSTPMPSKARIAHTHGYGIYLRQYPGGPGIATLYDGTIVTLLQGYQVAEGLVWLEIADPAGRTGWIPQVYLDIFTPTPSPIPTYTGTPIDTPSPSPIYTSTPTATP